MTLKTDKAPDVPPGGKNINEKSDAAQMALLALVDAINEAKKNGKLPPEASIAMENLRAGLAMVEQALKEDAPVSDALAEVSKAARELVALPAGELSEDELHEWNKLVLRAEEYTQNAGGAVDRLTVVLGNPEHPQSPENRERLLNHARELNNRMGMIIAVVRGAEIDEGGQDQKSQLRSVLVKQIQESFDVLSFLSGARDGKWLNEGAMHTAAGRGVVRNLAAAIGTFGTILDELRLSPADEVTIGKIRTSTKEISQALEQGERAETRRQGVRADDFLGSSRQRKRSA